MANAKATIGGKTVWICDGWTIVGNNNNDDGAGSGVRARGPALPQLPADELERRGSVCRQLCKGDDGPSSAFIATLPTGSDFGGTSMTWDPHPRRVRAIDRSTLQLVGRFPTFHGYGYVMFFKPSAKEALSMLPSSLFEPGCSDKYLIETVPFSNDAVACDIDQNFHLAITSVYRDPGDPRDAPSDAEVVVVVGDDGTEEVPIAPSQQPQAPVAGPADAATAGTKRDAPEEPEPIITVSSPETCIICLDCPADTLVLPCEHQVVCRVCSRQLKRTRDRHTCVQCRRPIQTVLCDGSDGSEE